MQLHKKIFIVALVLSICISLYFLINPSNIFTFPFLVSEFDDTTFKYYMFVKIGIVLLFIKFLLDICLEYIKIGLKIFDNSSHKGGWDKSPSLSIVFGVSIKTQWLSGLYYADFHQLLQPTQLCGGGTTKSNSNE